MRILAKDYHIHLLLLDMSQAFDTVNRKILFQHLEEMLNEDEMHIIGKLTNKPKITVKVGSHQGESFVTNTGMIQGDCLSAVLFIFYIAKCLEKPIRTKIKGFLIRMGLKIKNLGRIRVLPADLYSPHTTTSCPVIKVSFFVDADTPPSNDPAENIPCRGKTLPRQEILFPRHIRVVIINPVKSLLFPC